MSQKTEGITLRIDRRELATILAALRFHQDENLQGGRKIGDQTINEIATDGGILKPLNFDEVSSLCERLNTEEDLQAAQGLVIEPPPKERGKEQLFRVVYSIDVSARSPRRAAEQVHQIMVDPGSQPPVLDIIDSRGRVTRVDLVAIKPSKHRKDDSTHG